MPAATRVLLALLACGAGAGLRVRVWPQRGSVVLRRAQSQFLDPEGAPEQPAATANFTYNGDSSPKDAGSLPLSPAMTYPKYVTMSKKRVVVTFRYSGGSGFKATYEAAAKILKERFPDILVNKVIIEVNSARDEDQFDILVDGKLAYVKRKDKPGVYLQMRTLAQFIARARRRRRPNQLVYGDVETYEPEQQRLAQQLAEERALVQDIDDDDDIEDFSKFISAAGCDDAVGVGGINGGHGTNGSNGVEDPFTSSIDMDSLRESIAEDKKVVEALSTRWLELIDEEQRRRDDSNDEKL
mmetsp:Transcript_17329/g.53068  ORF Transcript_17329/g.53068 Transcript_17329/m.53068 type:complete len:298 (-) Transcript_17329:85-978(-)|eukprot:CAMPEP_0118865396 /NCGR_PEP_ID=MMETSP1163-20130328/9674_1 /TAXON_ID=124430 /ORGANISM="Phaeomonas parva, Strain CCMP2877" /LENGTH=297 /DNA_ID=CAMNT_0006799621 /DNA_START=129 /DNA_END=1022 /DNA_ORIENTATION=+